MDAITALLERPVYGLAREEKRATLTPILVALTQRHQRACEEYARFIRGTAAGIASEPEMEALPPLPVRLFKLYDFLSVPRESVFKVLTSSGTTGQRPSRVFLDTLTSQFQTKALLRILQQPLGRGRLPMLVADHPSVVQTRSHFSARGAGVIGVSTFGRDHTYALNDDMTINDDALSSFAQRHAASPVLIFGFTFMVWQYLIGPLRAADRRLPLHSGVLLHSGGWKKLLQQAVPKAEFKARARETLGITNVYDFYGMAEQVGSIFLECDYGRLHAPAFADVIVRNLRTGRPCATGETGVIQVLSALPISYPGHNLLTEDQGRMLGEDDCACGRLGRSFEVLGRLPRAEVRGCSDTHVAAAAR